MTSLRLHIDYVFYYDTFYNLILKFALQFKMRVPQMCNVVCRIVLTEKTAKEFKEKIDDEYRVNM